MVEAEYRWIEERDGILVDQLLVFEDESWWLWKR
jgi:hypothetical protein